MPRVSVIVPVYNAERYLERCTESLVNQTFTDLEIILVDDGSTDTSGQLCDRLATADARIKVLHCANGGVSAARNRGIEVATGEYLSFVDSDDWLSIDTYEKCLDTGADLVYCDYAEVFGDNAFPHKSYQVGVTRFDTIHNMLCAGPRGGNIFNFILVRKRLIDAENILFPVKFKRGEDFWFTLHCFVIADLISHVDATYYYDCSVTSSATHNELICSDSSYLSFMDECIDYLKTKGLWEEYRRDLGWRILLEKTVWVINPKYFHCYREIHPEVNSLVDSCPFLGRGMKIIMMLVDRRMDALAALLIYLNRLQRSFLKF